MMPIKSQGRVLGVISVARHDDTRFYDVADKECIELLANMLALDFVYRDIAEAYSKQQAAETTLHQVSVLGAFLAHKVPSVLGTISWLAGEFDKAMGATRDKAEPLLESLREIGRKADRLILQCRRLGKPLYLEPEIVPLEPLIWTALRHVETELDISVETSLTELPAVKVNPTLLVEVLEGVFQNAIDAMPNGGMLSIRSEFLSTGGDIRLHICDTGYGIAPKHRIRLFNTPFFTTKTDNGGSGSGFGLWLSKLYLQSVGGDIELTKTSGEGSTFTLSLPVPSHTFPVIDGAELPRQITNIPCVTTDSPSVTSVSHVLIVEDAVYWQNRLASPFRDLKWKVHMAKNKAKAIELLEQYDFNAFVVDINLNDLEDENMDGLDVVQELQRRGYSEPILVLSVWESMLTQARECFKAQGGITVMDKLDEALDFNLLYLVEQCEPRK